MHDYSIAVILLSQAIDYNPVLDLSAVPETMTTIFHRSSNGQVTVRYSETSDVSGDNTLSLDVEFPDLTDSDVDFEYRAWDEGMPKELASAL